MRSTRIVGFAVAAILGLMPVHAEGSILMALRTTGTEHTLSEVYVAEGRIGDNSTINNSGQREMGLHDAGGTGVNPLALAQRTWGNGIENPFALTYDSGGKLTFTVGGVEIYHTYAPPEDFEHIYIRSVAQGTKSGSTTIEDLNLETGGRTYLLSNSEFGLSTENTPNSKDVSYLLLQSSDFKEGFTISGTQSFAWTGETPNGGNLAFQFKIGTGEALVGVEAVTPIPEPSPLILGTMAAVLGGGVWYRRGRTSAAAAA